MANSGQLYLGDDSGFNRQLDWRHKIIDQDKQDRIEVANQLRDDVLTLGAKVSHNIERYGFGPSVDDDGKYIGRGTGGRDLEVMKRKVQETDRDFKLKHNEAIIKSGLIDIKTAKDYDLNKRWYGEDPVGLEKNHAKEVSRIMQDMGNYLPWQKIKANPTFYTKKQVATVLDIENSDWDQEKKTEALEAIQATPLVFTQWAERNKLVNTKYVNTYPQATKALRNRMIDMGYLDGNLFADTQNDGLYAQSNVDAALQGSSEVVDPLQVDLSGVDDDTGEDSANDAGDNRESVNETSGQIDSKGRKLLNVSMGLFGRKHKQWIYPDDPLYNRIDAKGNLIPEEEKKIIGYKDVFTNDRRRVKKVPIYEGEDNATSTSSDNTLFKGLLGGSGTANASEVASIPMTARMKKKVEYEGGIEKTDGKLYIDGGDISFPGGINAGSWAYGKKPEDKRMFARLLAQDDNGKIDESLANNILDVLNTQAGTGGEAANARMKKFGTGNWDNIQISKRGMVSGMKFISKHNLSELVRTNSFLKDPNTAGRELNQKLPKDFRDMIEDFTYRFGGGAFSGSDSLKTPNKEKLPFEKTLKAIVEAKTKEERVAALYKFRDLFKLTRVYKNERKSDRIQDAIKTIDALAWKAAQGGW